MQLNLLEKALMNNPLRAALHRHFEARRLRRMGGKVNGAEVLEIGCGRGFGARLLFEEFGAGIVHAFDLDLRMVRLAHGYHIRRAPRPLFWVADAVHIPVSDARYDAVFDFGALHHVVPWRDALQEAYRVLKPGGRLFVEEILDKYIVHPLFRRLLHHPQQDRFNRRQFTEALEQIGFDVIATEEKLQLYAWFVADKPPD